MLIPIQEYKEEFEVQRSRAIKDLLHNTRTNDYINEKSFTEEELLSLLDGDAAEREDGSQWRGFF